MNDVRERLEAARLNLLLTRESCRRDPLEALAAALDGGVDLVQIREKGLADGELLAWIRAAHRVCEPRGIPLIVNDRADLAFLAGAEGVHLGQDDLPVEEARRLLGDAPLVGVSTHDPEELRAALRPGVDYLGLGAFFPSGTKGVTPRGPALLGRCLSLADRPVFGIGGLDVERLPEAAACGLRRIAVCGAICGAEDPAAAAAALKGTLIAASL